MVFLVSCQKEDPYLSEGTITGPDFRECACCGGWFIDIGGETYRFQELPCSCSLDLMNEEFPLDVFLDWKKDPDGCLGDEIIVYRIKKK